MTTLTVLPSGKSYEVAAGTSLLKALQAAGEPIISKCGGEAKCESCHVYVTVGRKSLSKIQRVENEKLDGIVGVSSNSRLACQALLGEEAVTVELLK
ncbi:2Fe-2S iron-sulfur cluster-binding protein [Rhodoferax sp.]|uniref:2Fe-2S iron-sulfur cluster-binding protein n=1 Tax=Rhodoferax sp. TaxID=50421 RepID=UPI00261970D8|nr:2Fe-2S iron-sulfur cluster-binding protein [Rhodoferax sp.]MDD2926655.1 2Fe-2S iron-sulfur cluster-binding protein [Rhodoferax sp.]